jgi:hypothetical protein
MRSLTDDAYQLWLDNAVTQQFLEMANERLSGLRSQDRVTTGSIEQIAFDAIAVQSQIDCLEQILSWRPEHGRD